MTSRTRPAARPPVPADNLPAPADDAREGRP
ncbi:hypothetical protein FB387_004802 [Streptomyces cinereoruber]|nr:hypothetical protein [Streptomyces cinereoruber]NIH63591.1 hypothetical protein [Streptomyces cinereoruber]